MCGIAGMLMPDGRQVDEQLLRAMIDRVGHRGPDAIGLWKKERVGFAHARLSIIDLAGGAQPMGNEDGSIWVTFNGEIFNYIELRKDLEARGHVFSTSCDTEVILHAYEEKGPECVHDFNGQWAFALWDTRKGEMFLSRDRLGIRPMFYAFHEGAFLFGSEMKTILGFPGFPRKLDLKGLDQVLTFWCCLPPRTMFEGIEELPPGHSMMVKGGDKKVWRYWGLSYPTEFGHVDEKACAGELLDLLVDATRLRLRSDVPVGAYLSGGLDSSVTTALIKHLDQSALKTFSVTFDRPEYDESAHQQEVVKYLGTEHQSVQCSPSDIGRIFPDVIWHTEKPVLRTAPAPLYMLSKLVRQNGFKVVFTGEGADEMLGGYDIFKEDKVRRFWARDPSSRLRPLLLKQLYPYMPNLQSQSPAYLQAFFQVRPDELQSPFFSHLPRWDLTAKAKSFYAEGAQQRLTGYDAREELMSQLPAEFHKWHPFCRAQYLEAAYLLPGYILSSQGDRMGMAHAVEGRFPFLDYRVAEFSAKIPPRLKMRGLNEKYILKQAIGTKIPDSIRNRSKQPYRAPEGASFMGKDGKELPYVAELLSERRIKQSGIFDPSMVKSLLDKTRRGVAVGVKDNMALVGIISTQLVVDQFIENFRRLDSDGNA